VSEFLLGREFNRGNDLTRVRDFDFFEWDVPEAGEDRGQVRFFGYRVFLWIRHGCLNVDPSVDYGWDPLAPDSTTAGRSAIAAVLNNRLRCSRGQLE
jgi:hypothetical protein